MTASHDSETPAVGQQVISACALIWHEFDGVKKVFLPKRAATKKFLPSVFELPGGHVNFAEDIIEGLKRECMEELGMRVSVGDAFATFTYVNDIKGSHSIQVDFFGKFLDPIENIKLDSEDHSEFIWVSLSEVPPLGQISPEQRTDVVKGLELLNGQAHNFG